MPHRPRSYTTLPEDLPLLKVLAELAGVLVLLLGLKVADFVRWVVWPATQSASKPTTPTTRATARPMPPLQWRSPWWGWQSLAWAITTLTSPTFVFIGSLLAINSRSDHPLFWWSLPAIVAIGNAIAILWINQQHHRDPFTDQQSLARRHVVVSTVTGASLFLFVGMVSGFLPDIVGPLSGAATAAFPAVTTTLWSAAAAIAFGVLSFAHAGFLHATLGFEVPAPVLGPRVIG